MKLKKFKAENVHGFLNYDITFRDDITFLIGINGTGKTSVLKLILGLISPSYNYLNQIDFDLAQLECEFDEEEEMVSQLQLSLQNFFEINDVVSESLLNDNILSKKSVVITAKRNESIVTLSLLINDQIIEGTLTKYTIHNDIVNEETREKQNFFRQKFESQTIYTEIKKLTTPLFLGIDRKIYEGHNIDRSRTSSYTLRRRFANYPTNDPLNLSLIDVQGLLYDYYRVIAAKQPSINEKFKNKIFAQTFEFIESDDINITNDFKEIKLKRSQIQNAIKNLNVGEFKDKIDTFFDKMEYVLREFNNIQKRTSENKFLIQDINPKRQIETYQRWFTNQPQLRRINEIIEFSQSYQAEVEALYEPVNKLKSLINHFFNESKKNIDIDEKGEMKIFFNNGTHAELFQLSSGEKQIISMLANLIFFQMRYEKEGGIFIIDEPELSLHLAWQEIFVESLKQASPNTQFIMATHSPAIIAEYGDDYCEDLIKLN